LQRVDQRICSPWRQRVAIRPSKSLRMGRGRRLRSICQTSRFDRIGVVDQKQEHIPVTGIERGRVLGHVHKGIVGHRRPVHHARDLPTYVTRHIARDLYDRGDQLMIPDAAIVQRSNERETPYRRAVAATWRGAYKLSSTILSFSSSDQSCRRPVSTTSSRSTWALRLSLSIRTILNNTPHSERRPPPVFTGRIHLLPPPTAMSRHRWS
jgi:hypothetical protein